eukprot:3825879-Alexandrium_andersonii.AAC.1
MSASPSLPSSSMPRQGLGGSSIWGSSWGSRWNSWSGFPRSPASRSRSTFGRCRFPPAGGGWRGP